MKKYITLLVLSFLWIAITAFKSERNTFILDKGHTHIGFEVERFLVGDVSGRFNDFDATLSMDGNNYGSLQLEAVIQVGSLDSNNDIRDGHLKGEVWLDEANHPEIKFTSTQVFEEENQFFMKGKFTIKGTTQEVQFPVEIQGPFKDPTQQVALGIKADFSINRFDYGITFNKKMDNGHLFIGDQVHIKIRALAYQK
ncbi:YceI family protein [Flagellimonas sp.]|uniref:YceI family protein n=1 Tax=Flagellimonas sp. TaxID=2058762 RepID=UPI003F4A0AB3